MNTIDTPQDMAELMKKCVATTHEYTTICNEKFGLKLPKFKVEFTLRGRTAGKAWLGKNIIQFNPTLLRENPEAFIKRTPGHEVVHFAAYAKYGGRIKAHGHEWKNMMSMVGLDNKRCHSYNTDHVPTQINNHPNKAKTYGVVVQTELGTVRTFGVGKQIEFD